MADAAADAGAALPQAGETSKLLITLSIALVAFCAAVVNVEPGKPVLFSPAGLPQTLWLAAAWLALLAAVGAGVWVQLAVTDVMAGATPERPADPWARKITVPFKLQVLAFGGGVVLLVAYGIGKLFG